MISSRQGGQAPAIVFSPEKDTGYFCFEQALTRMAEITSLPVVQVNFPGPGVRYETSNKLIRDTLGYRPEWTFDRMLEEAAKAWKNSCR